MNDKTAILAVNAQFYRALSDGDLATMHRIWARGRPVSCTHPSGPAILGRSAVMQSFATIFQHGAPRGIAAKDCAVVVTGATGLLICLEVVGDTSLMAANAFHREQGAWVLVNHQAAHINAENRA